MLERMDAFFERRLEGYDLHMMTHIEGAGEFYPFTAERLPQTPEATVLDLGCGTGLELEAYFKLNPTARVTGIDLSAGMLEALRKKIANPALTLRQGSYFDLDLGENSFDAAVSVESLHHFTKEEKIGLYKKVKNALKPGAYLILTDYFAASDKEERDFRAELLRLKREQGIDDGAFYHYDTPLTVAHETQALLEAGFDRVEVLKSWGATCTLWAGR
ncbi:MAG: class I SAM-dependent methyltransferase [Clostridia bacterium]|nr:class I SAM-dependent methyltransferase [Clostridia bacterium]